MQYAKSVTLNVEECDRLSFLPYLFGQDFLYAEASVYALAKKMMPEYEGGFWHFIRLPDGGGSGQFSYAGNTSSSAKNG
ncbi:TPA: antirestriction protein [Escherichia coli]|nr:antirestriction protein [Escherichia coli]HEI2378928.1 antirestriction protein [Escherichia coli]HEI2401384.1 antirestriction protein [Escherichia coli]HEI2418542.1 antirestriction protein [Escherichia coli]HEI2588981.1 antirestriction protein [Escherichia coli]